MGISLSGGDVCMAQQFLDSIKRQIQAACLRACASKNGRHTSIGRHQYLYSPQGSNNFIKSFAYVLNPVPVPIRKYQRIRPGFRHPGKHGLDSIRHVNRAILARPGI